MTLVLPSVKGSPLNVSEFEGNYAHIIGLQAGYVTLGDARLSDARTPLSHTQAISTVTGLQAALDGKTTAAALSAGLATKLDYNDVSVTNARLPVDGGYGLFTITGGQAAMVTATPAEMFAGTAGKGVGANGLYALQQPTTVTPAAGVLTLNWLAANIPTLNALCAVSANVTSIAISNLPLWRTCTVLFELGGAYSIAIPAHNATVDGKTFKRLDNATWPALPSANGAVVILALTATSNRIYAALGGLCSL
jgi:hypothetical protein